MAGAIGASYDDYRPRQADRRNRHQDRQHDRQVEQRARRASKAAPTTTAETLTSVPRLRGRLYVPHRAQGRREWATTRKRYWVRVGWRVAPVSDNVVELLRAIDGQRSVGELAVELTGRLGRPVHPAEITYLLRTRLLPARLIALKHGGNGSVLAPATRTARGAEVGSVARVAPALVAATKTAPMTTPVPAMMTTAMTTAMTTVPVRVLADGPTDTAPSAATRTTPPATPPTPAASAVPTLPVLPTLASFARARAAVAPPIPPKLSPPEGVGGAPHDAAERERMDAGSTDAPRVSTHEGLDAWSSAHGGAVVATSAGNGTDGYRAVDDHGSRSHKHYDDVDAVDGYDEDDVSVPVVIAPPPASVQPWHAPFENGQDVTMPLLPPVAGAPRADERIVDATRVEEAVVEEAFAGGTLADKARVDPALAGGGTSEPDFTGTVLASRATRPLPPIEAESRVSRGDDREGPDSSRPRAILYGATTLPASMMAVAAPAAADGPARAQQRDALAAAPPARVQRTATLAAGVSAPRPQASGPGMRSALRGRLGQLGRAAKSVLGLACLALALGVALGLLLHQTPSATTPGRTSVAHSARSAASPPTERILPGETAYIVRRGDRLASIAARFHVSPGALMLINADILKPKASLVVGTRLAIPAVYRPGVDPRKQPRPLYYYVRRGDTLYDIGTRFGVDWSVIAAYNHLANPRALVVGEGLVIPASAAHSG